VVGKTASTELSERAKDKAAGQKEQARGGQRPRARAWQPAALITNLNSRCKMFASPSRGARGIGHNNPALKGTCNGTRIIFDTLTINSAQKLLLLTLLLSFGLLLRLGTK